MKHSNQTGLGLALALLALVLTASCRSGKSNQSTEPGQQNVLSEDEADEGWMLLFDGNSTAGWHHLGKSDAPSGWDVVDGCLARTGPGGDIVTKGLFENFILELEWKISEGGNSGIFFHVAGDSGSIWETGPEVQVLDNLRHADGANPLTSAGSNFALHAPYQDVTRPVGEFNHMRLVVRGGKVIHMMNGKTLLEYRLNDADWEARVKASKFADMPRYGRAGSGHIALQDHGDPVWFRNIKLLQLE